MKKFTWNFLTNKKFLIIFFSLLVCFIIYQTIFNFFVVSNIVKIIIELTIFLAALFTVINFLPRNKKENDKSFQESIPAEVISLSTAEVVTLSSVKIAKNLKELNEISNKHFFETPLKPVYNKDWDYIYENEIYFEDKQKIQFSENFKIYFITGKAGSGKSAFLLWNISKILSDESNQFKNAVFIDPENFLNDNSWIKKISVYDNNSTLLIIDALWRGLENVNDVSNRLINLFNIVKGAEEFNETVIGPFNILITIRDDELENLLRIGKFASFPTSLYEKLVVNNSLILRNIIDKYILSYSSSYNGTFPSKLIDKLISKSEGNPFYIRLVFEDIKKQADKNFELEDFINSIPDGYLNYLWKNISKNFGDKGKYFPFVFLLLSNISAKFSRDFFNFADEVINDKFENTTLINNFISTFCFPSESIENNYKLTEYTIENHFKTAILQVNDNPSLINATYRSTVDNFIFIKKNRFNALKGKIINALEEHLNGGFKEIADINYCHDLAKFSPDKLEKAIEIFIDKSTESELEKLLIESLRKQLYLLCIEHAVKARKKFDNEKVQKFYELAFDKLGVVSEKIDLTAYAGYIAKHIIYLHKNNSEEFNSWKDKVLSLIEYALKIDDRDIITRQTLALFYKEIGMFDEADNEYQKSLEIDPDHIPAINAYALFLRQLARFEWVRDIRKSKEYFDKAEEQFNTALEKLKDLPDIQNNSQFQAIEMQLKNSYANFLQSKTEWYSSYEDRVKIDTQVESTFEEILAKYPNHGHSVNNYAHFLINKAKILPKYKGNKNNLIKAEKMLKDFIDKEKNKKGLSYYMALHLLGRYLYTIKANRQQDSEIEYEAAAKYLKESGESFEIKHNSIALNELGQLYLKQSRGADNKDELLNQARDSFTKSIELLNENKHNALHLGKVHLNLAKAFSLIKNNDESLNCINKAIDIVDKYSCLPFDYYFTLLELGENCYHENEYNMAEKIYKKALSVYNRLHGEETKLNPSIIYVRLGELSLKKNNYVKSAKYFKKSLENCSEAIFFTNIRLELKKVMVKIVQKKEPELYDKLLTLRIKCSEQACKLEPDNIKNYADYGIDLNLSQKYDDAIKVFSKAIQLLEKKKEEQGTSQYSEDIGRLYFELAFSYKGLHKQEKAKESFLKALEYDKSAISYMRYTKYLLQINDTEEVLKAFENVIELYANLDEEKKEIILENLPEVLKDMAFKYKGVKNNKESLRCFELCSDLYFYDKDSKRSEILGSIALQFKNSNKLITSRRIFIQSIRKDPDNAKNLSQLGEVSFQLGLYSEAAKALLLAINLRTHEEQYFIIKDEEIYEKCMDKIKSSEHSAPAVTNCEALINEAILFELDKKNVEAKEKFNKFYDDFKNNKNKDKIEPELLMLAADSLWHHGEIDKAISLKRIIYEIKKGKLESIVLDAVI